MRTSEDNLLCLSSPSIPRDDLSTNYGLERHYNTRQISDLSLTLHNYSTTPKSFVEVSVNTFNVLPYGIIELNLKNCYSKIKLILLQLALYSLTSLRNLRVKSSLSFSMLVYFYMHHCKSYV